jgi:hypothetical protein
MEFTKYNFTNIKRNNEMLKTNINRMMDRKIKKNDTYGRKVTLLNTTTNNIRLFNNYLFYLYIIACIILTYFLFLNESLPYYYKIVILICACIYPYISYYIISYITNLYNYIYSIFFGIPYDKK